MNQIKVTYVDHMGDDLRVVNSARISFNSESEDLTKKDEKLINYLAKNKHMSPFEHNILTVIVECPLFIRSQIHRHRAFSFNEISRRYTSENIEFFMPDKFRSQHKTSKQCSDNDLDDSLNSYVSEMIEDFNDYANSTYECLLYLGVARELARMILPQSLMTKFYMTGNLRNWVHFVKLRIDNHAQKEVQYIGQQILDILYDKFPVATKSLMEDK